MALNVQYGSRAIFDELDFVERNPIEVKIKFTFGAGLAVAQLGKLFGGAKEKLSDSSLVAGYPVQVSVVPSGESSLMSGQKDPI